MSKPAEHSASLIGRQQEIDLLTDQLALATTGQCRAVFLSGEPGIGKTRLLRFLAEEALRQQIIVLRSSAFEAEGMPSYLLFLEALSPYIQATPVETLREQAGAFAAVLGTIFPELTLRLGELPTSYPLPPEQARLRFFEAVSTFLAGIAAAHGLLLIFDDLQWADKASLDLLSYLMRHQPDARLLIFGAYRDGEVSLVLENTIAELNRLRVLSTLPIAPLAAQEVEALGDQYLGAALDAEAAQLLAVHSEGNPFFAEELLRDWLETKTIRVDGEMWHLAGRLKVALPSSIVGAIRQRLSRVAPVTRDPLRAAAIIGRMFDVTLLAEVTDQAVEQVEDSLRQVEQMRLLRANPDDTYTFSHDKIRECLYEEVSISRRRRLHGLIGQALEQRSSSPDAQLLVELAFHFTRSGDVERGISYALRAAELALRMGAFEEAAAQYQTALDLTPSANPQRGQLLLKFGEAAVLAGHEQNAINAFTMAEARFREARDKVNAAAAAHKRGSALWRLESLSAAKTAFETALTLLNDKPTPATVEILVDLSGLLAVSLFEPREGYRQAERALQLAQTFEDDLLVTKASRTVGNLLVRENQLQDGMALLERALELAIQIDDPVEAVECCALLGIACYWNTEIGRAVEILQLQLRFAERCHDSFQLRHIYTNRAICYQMAGQFAEAEQMFAQAQTVVEKLNNPEALAYHQLSVGWLAHLRGDDSTAEPLVSGGIAVLRTIAANAVSWYLGWLGLIQLAQGKQQAALACTVELEVLITALPEGILPTSEPLHHLILLALGLDDDARIARYADRLRAFSGQIHDVLTDRLLGMIATRRGEWENARALLAAAESTARRENIRIELVEIWIAQGELMRAQSDGLSETADALFEQALLLSQQMGYRLGEQQVQMLRNHARTKSAVPVGLSRREIDVLRLVAEGKTNHQIAETLFISEKTVEKHLTSIFTKTGSDNRAGATAFAYQHGIVQPR